MEGACSSAARTVLNGSVPMWSQEAQQWLCVDYLQVLLLALPRYQTSFLGNFSWDQLSKIILSEKPSPLHIFLSSSHIYIDIYKYIFYVIFHISVSTMELFSSAKDRRQLIKVFDPPNGKFRPVFCLFCKLTSPLPFLNKIFSLFSYPFTNST